MKRIIIALTAIFMALYLSGCTVISVASTAIGATITVVEGAVDVVDAVTPDVFDDEDEEDSEEESEEEKDDVN